ncbi:SHOCT domain-containing protein [Actinacidiphila yeochonensis]|uniref:SHOCT domain-containing protein n=1 Tax=Actinacidiphila yeochonensis TaxID=89050 RepID=UPI0005617A8F|nr:SHOCT domain-containing protein [Actinacidiphila yeochonensis]
MTHTYLASDYPVLGAFWTILLFTAAVLWLILLFRIVVDVFRDDEMSGWGKTGWLLLVIFLPFLGVFVYVVSRGRGMGQRELRHAQQRQQEFDSYVRDTALGGGIPERTQAQELADLAEMHDKGALSDEEFRKAKAEVLR